jgi:hypothetical protein
VEKMDMETGRWVPMGDVSGTYTRWVERVIEQLIQVKMGCRVITIK